MNTTGNGFDNPPDKSYNPQRPFLSYESPSPIFQYEMQLIKDKFNVEKSFFNNLEILDRFAKACNSATERQNKITVETKKESDKLKNEYNSLNLKYKILEISSQNENQILKKEIQNLKRKVEDLQQNQTKQKVLLDDKDKKIIQKDFEITIVKKQSQDQLVKVVSSLAQKISSLLNDSKKVGGKIINDSNNPATLIEPLLNEIKQKINDHKYLKMSQQYMLASLKKSIEILKQVQSAKYSPRSFKQGHQVEFFKGLANQIETKIINKLPEEHRKENPFVSQIVLIKLINQTFSNILSEWAQALKLSKQSLDTLTKKSQTQAENVKNQINEMNDKLNHQQLQKSRIQKSLETTIKDYSLALKNFQAAKKQNKQLEQKLSSALAKISQLQAQIVQENQKHKGDIQRIIKKQDSDKKRQITELKTNHETKIKRIQKDLQNQKSENDQLKKQLEQKNASIQRFTKQVDQLQKKLQAQIQTNQQMTEKNRNSTFNLANKQTRLAQLQRNIHDLTRNKATIQGQLDQKIINLQNALKEINLKAQRINELQDLVNRDLQPKLQNLTRKLEQSQRSRNQAVQGYNQIVRHPPREYLQYFNGHILNYSTRQQLKWFVENLEKNCRRTIRSTKPLYRFDPKNKESFHTYIDSNPFIVLLVKVWNGQLIAGYSRPAFVRMTNVENQQGYIFGLKNKKTFRVKREPSNNLARTNPKPITYDDYFLIWGNTDIRIRSGLDELYSNYATANGSYEEVGNQNSTIKDLFMQDQRESKLTDYELFAVEWNDY